MSVQLLNYHAIFILFIPSVPILHDDRQVRKAVVLTNGTLHIDKIEANDAKVSYSCRAYNNIGTAVHTYRLIVNGEKRIDYI